MEKFLDVFGKKIKIETQARVVSVSKFNESVVTLCAISQDGSQEQMPIFTIADYGKTSDEFIKEFNKLNYFATKKEMPLPPAPHKSES